MLRGAQVSILTEHGAKTKSEPFLKAFKTFPIHITPEEINCKKFLHCSVVEQSFYNQSFLASHPFMTVQYQITWTRSSKDECSTDVQSLSFNEQIILINRSKDLNDNARPHVHIPPFIDLKSSLGVVRSSRSMEPTKTTMLNIPWKRIRPHKLPNVCYQLSSSGPEQY